MAKKKKKKSEIQAGGAYNKQQSGDKQINVALFITAGF